MNLVAEVIHAFADAWSRRRIIVPVYLALRLMTYAVLVPVLGGLINLAVSFSSQAALTDQDIAGYILTPGGFVATIAVLSLLLVVEVLGFAVMTAIWRSGGGEGLAVARTAFWAVARQVVPLLEFAARFVLRILLLAAPFVLLSLLVAWKFLSTYDINYYLTYKPPEALIAAGLIAVLLLLLAIILLIRLSDWALALHLVLFQEASPKAAFAKSKELMATKRLRLQGEILIWLATRFGLVGLLGLLAGTFLRFLPIPSGEEGLRLALTAVLILLALWWLAATVVSALSLGALSRLVNTFYQGKHELEPILQPVSGGTRQKLLGAVLALAVLTGGGLWAGARLLDDISTPDKVEIIAHRGAAGSRPENTMASVERAIEDGADWIEIDVQETADNQVVVMHDSDFMKLSGVDLKIWDATMPQLAEVDIGSWFDPAYADQRTPLLRDVLLAAKGRSKVLIELKYYGHDVDLENRVIEIVEELGMEDQIATMSLKYPAVLKMLTLRPEWRTGVLAATAIGDLTNLEGAFVAVNTGQASQRLANSITAADKDLYVWTVNDPLAMSKMISMGADGLITDEPKLARSVLELRAGLSTPQRLLLWMTEVLGLKLNEKVYRDGSP